MTTRPLPKCPSFADWYEAVNDRKPFPWQGRLADHVAAESDWPRLVGIPTGLGKTACIDIAIWALAHQADLEPENRTAPTRLWWVVNRRLLVDDTYIHAERVAQSLAESTEGPLAAIAGRLRHIADPLGGSRLPLEVVHLRGGGRREVDHRVTVSRSWRPSTPAQPAVICSTIPMFGSRLLFRGYGTSRSMRPIDAALAYTDSLVIIDEAHLAATLRGLLADLAQLSSATFEPTPEARRAPVVVAVTATGDTNEERFELDHIDHSHSTIRQRVDALKPISIKQIKRATTPSKVATGMVSALKELVNGVDPGVSLLFVNSPVTARLVAGALRSNRNNDVVVATGQIRGHEAAKVTRDIVDQAGCGVDRRPRKRHLTIVATQTLEVGADIDADYLLTEACGVRALTQRLGRLNRLGQRPHAKGVYLHTPGKNGRWPVYGEEPAEVLARLERDVNAQGVVDLSSGRIEEVLGDPQDRPDPAPVATAGILWEWTKTTTPPPGEAPVDPYFAGYDDPQRHVYIAWRAHLPERTLRLWPKLRGDETVEVALPDVIDALERLNNSARWAALDSRYRRANLDSSQDLRPGSTVLVHADVGLLDLDGHWDPAATDAVLDVSILNSGLPIASGVLRRIYGGAAPKGSERTINAIELARDEGDAETVQEECYRLCKALLTASPPGISESEWAEFITDIENGIDTRIRSGLPAVIEPKYEVPRLPRTPSTGPMRPTAHSDEDDEISLCDDEGDRASLAGHGDHTANIADRTAKALGVPPSISRIVVKAAKMHDIGKADPRFQASLNPGWERGQPMAKSGQTRSVWARNRAWAGWPDGGRHEELSRRLVEKWLRITPHGLEPHEADLLQHLVVSHHGRGRPLVIPARDATSGPSLTYKINGVTVDVSPNLEVSDWTQPTRFATLTALYGPWGLALLETIVRQSDHVASAVVDVQ